LFVVRVGWTLALVLGACCIGASPARAQTNTGYQSCGGQECHTKSGEIEWLTDKPGGKEHKASLLKMRQARENSEKYAKAVNLDNFENQTGMCVKCHATYVDKGKTLEGVGCEACHGPASGYRQFHSQTPKDYAGAVQQGMRNLQAKPATWVKECRDCHVLDGKPEYEALIEAGHKDNARWNVVKKYQGVSAHWKKVMHIPAVIEAALKGINPPRAAVATATSTAPGPAAPAPASAPPAAPGPAPSAPTPPPTTVPAATAPPSRVAASGAGPSPKPPMGTASGSNAKVPATLSNSRVSAPTVVPPPAPLPTVATPAPSTLPVAVDPSPLALTLPPAVTATGLMAALQDRLAGLLESLLRKNVVPAVPLQPVDLTPQITGPDADFLRLQSEALALAIEALNLRARPPATPDGAKPPSSSPPK